MDTIREQIIQAVITRVETILTANGYNSECGQKVKRATKELEPDDLPALVVWPQTEEAERRSGKNICTTQIKVEAFVRFGEESASVVQERVLADLIKCVTDPAAPVSPLVDDLYYKEGGPSSHPEAGEVVTGVVATFEIKYSYKLGNPYEQ